MSACPVTVVGRLYEVPCLLVSPHLRTRWMPDDGYVPVLGPKHRDAEHLMFPDEHYHVDWRFIPTAQYRSAISNEIKAPHAKVITASTDYRTIGNEPVLRRLKCFRKMPSFPAIPAELETPHYRESGKRWRNLEIAQAFTCNKLKPGNICPHRGIDLTPFAKADGTAICPGHGMRWNLKTGELMPRHGAPAATGQEGAP